MGLSRKNNGKKGRQPREVVDFGFWEFIAHIIVRDIPKAM
jgi:hypothetical protein